MSVAREIREMASRMGRGGDVGRAVLAAPLAIGRAPSTQPHRVSGAIEPRPSTPHDVWASTSASIAIHVVGASGPASAIARSERLPQVRQPIEVSP
jgi:hypothetical protein